MSDKAMVKLRFIDHVVDEDGNPVPHPTKEKQWARNGGQIPLIDKDGFPRAVLPGESFEVEEHIAEDLLSARPGVIVREADYQRRAVHIETRRAESEAERYALAGQFRTDKARSIAQTKLAAQVERTKRQKLREELDEAGDKPAASVEALTAQFAKLESDSKEKERAAADRIAMLERQIRELAEQKAHPEADKTAAEAPVAKKAKAG